MSDVSVRTVISNIDIKTQYEANTDTNCFTDAEQTKLLGIEADAQVNDKIAYGGISITNNSNPTIISIINIFYKCEVFNINKTKYNTTPNHEQNHIEIDVEGAYQVYVSASALNGNDKNFKFKIFKNEGSTPYNNLMAEQKIPISSDINTFNILGQIRLYVGDTLELWVTNTNSIDDITFKNVSFSVCKIGP